jgi:hypothetical protein
MANGKPRSPGQVTEDKLRLDVEAYYQHNGNKSEAARARGLKRQTYADRLRAAEERLGVTLGKVADGQLEARSWTSRELPAEGHVRRYVLTSAQNNTLLHPAFSNLLALVSFLDGLADGSCELIVGTYSYQVSAYGPKAVKRGTFDRRRANEALWYAPELSPYIVDESVELAPGLVWCGEMNIMPTAPHPLNGLEQYRGRRSLVVPHARMELESVASMADEATKLCYSTGTVTQRNYIQKRAGILAEQRHDYGGVLVEVDHVGNWFVRQLAMAQDGSIMDVGPDGYVGLRGKGRRRVRGARRRRRHLGGRTRRGNGTLGARGLLGRRGHAGPTAPEAAVLA